MLCFCHHSPSHFFVLIYSSWFVPSRFCYSCLYPSCFVHQYCCLSVFLSFYYPSFFSLAFPQLIFLPLICPWLFLLSPQVSFLFFSSYFLLNCMPLMLLPHWFFIFIFLFLRFFFFLCSSLAFFLSIDFVSELSLVFHSQLSLVFVPGSPLFFGFFFTLDSPSFLSLLMSPISVPHVFLPWLLPSGLYHLFLTFFMLSLNLSPPPLLFFVPLLYLLLLSLNCPLSWTFCSRSRCIGLFNSAEEGSAYSGFAARKLKIAPEWWGRVVEVKQRRENRSDRGMEGGREQ